MKWDPKLFIWAVGIVFVAGGGWWSLQSVSTDVTKIQDTLDGQGNELIIHIAADGHEGNVDRMKNIETAHVQMGEDIRAMMVNQSAICQATGARCR